MLILTLVKELSVSQSSMTNTGSTSDDIASLKGENNW